jgi:hypothetical protein
MYVVLASAHPACQDAPEGLHNLMLRNDLPIIGEYPLNTLKRVKDSGVATSTTPRYNRFRPMFTKGVGCATTQPDTGDRLGDHTALAEHERAHEVKGFPHGKGEDRCLIAAGVILDV